MSRDLMRAAIMSVEQIVRTEMVYDMAIKEETAFLTGDGDQKPLGIFVATSEGISTARDVSAGNTSSSITFDGLSNAKYSLKVPYRNRASWMFHRTNIMAISQLKDGVGQYLWQPSRQIVSQTASSAGRSSRASTSPTR